jgi:hypothetical protein
MACHLQIDADPDSVLDPAYHFDADPDPDPGYQINANPCGSGSTKLLICKQNLKDTLFQYRYGRTSSAP